MSIESIGSMAFRSSEGSLLQSRKRFTHPFHSFSTPILPQSPAHSPPLSPSPSSRSLVSEVEESTIRKESTQSEPDVKKKFISPSFAELLRTGSKKLSKQTSTFKTKFSPRTAFEQRDAPSGNKTTTKATETLTEYVDRKFAEAKKRTEEARNRFLEVESSNQDESVRVKVSGPGT